MVLCKLKQGVEMNFAEGSKRIYIVLCCIILMVYAGVRFSEFPSKETVAPWLSYQLKKAITDDWDRETGQKSTRYQIDFGDLKPSDFFEESCKKGIMPKTETEKVCQQYRLEIEGLPWTRTKYIGETFGVIFATAVGASLLWALLAWIGRGFKKDQ